jgi:hypothetical protein
MSIASQGYGLPGNSSLPAFVERAQQDAQWQSTLTRMGYRRVKAAYARQMRDLPKAEVFYGAEHLQQWPTMDFVRAWLKSEKRRLMARVRWTFVSAMLATIVAGLTFTAALFVLR